MHAFESRLICRTYLLGLAVFAGTASIASQAQVSSISAAHGGSNGIDLVLHASVDKSTAGAESSSYMPGVAGVNAAETLEAPGVRGSMSRALASSAIAIKPVPALASQSPVRYGGDHEFTLTSGISRMSGHWLGYRRDVSVEVINLRYSLVIANRQHVTVSFSPEITPYINLDEPILDHNDEGSVEIGRKQTVGGGVSPAGFTFDFLPSHRIQPFWRCNYGVLYFHDRVLSPEGSQFMHTVDFGLGLHIYQSRYVSTTLGFRYIHLSNANIAMHNPGTDGETFYIGFSRFHSPKVRDIVR